MTQPARVPSGGGGALDWLLALMVFVHILLYEIVYFFSPAWYTPAVWVWKAAFPLGLFVVFGLRNLREFAKDKVVLAYVAAFAAFNAWLLVANMLTGGVGDGTFQWAKEVPRLLFFFGAFPLFVRRPRVFQNVCKLAVGWSLLAVVQYALVASFYERVRITDRPQYSAIFAGPFDILGNVTSILSLPELGIFVPRLAGWWNEPSNAAGFLIAAGFLAYGLARELNQKLWNVAGAICAIGSVLALSNAGYLGLGVAIAAGATLRAFSRRRHAWQLLFAPAVGIGLGIVALYGRPWVMQNAADDPIARAFVGVRGQVDVNQTDPLAGRADLFRIAVDTIQSRPLGIGLGRNPSLQRSASAPIFWLLAAGIPGLLLLATREAVLLVGCAQRRSLLNGGIPITQAWLGLLTVQASYGQWMNPYYLTLSAAVLAFRRRTGEPLGSEASNSP